MLVYTPNLKVFGADDYLDFLTRCHHRAANGTFKMAPQGYMQLYKIHGFDGEMSFPCVFSVMKSKSNKRMRTAVCTNTNAAVHAY
jgi:hypothetical protein